ncbi:CLUMA_CG002615, isoform A [Clunio marinus]|uniref:CLUMA_CG002615, isoform A n=1 Tax=Clunio marinus TaxID=568069 RepID=A0A1J1HL73_9DIPT|nr:CLUMA_CG002615, isoform A [Clunio marinus]
MMPTFKGDIKEYKPFKESMTTALERMELSTLSTRKLQTRMGNVRSKIQQQTANFDMELSYF